MKSANGMSRRQFIKVAGATALGLAAGGCAPAATPLPLPPTATRVPPTAVKKGGALTYAHLSDFVTFDGHRLHAASFPMFNLIYNSLIVLDKDMRPQPELAESWQFSDDNRTLTLKLRSGVKFHTGREMTSEDVKFNIEYIQDPKSAANSRPLALLIEKVEIPDKYTVVLKLKRVAPNIFDLLDMANIMAPESVPDLAKKGVGTGPFKLEEWRPGESAKFTRFADYFKPGLPLLDGVLVRVLGDAASMVVGLENSSIDVIERFPAQEAARLQKTQGLKVNNIFAGFIADILINTKKTPFDNKLVRQAVGYALNKQRMIDVAMGGIGEPWCLPFPKNSIAYNPDVAAGCKYDVAEGKRLLEKAGLGSGFEFDLLVSGPVLPASPLQAQIWQADLAQMGVKAKIVDVESADYYARTGDRKYDVAVHQFRGANRDPDSLFLSVIPWYTKNNFSQFESEEYARLVEAAGSTADPEKRKALYKDLGKLILDEAFVFCLAPAPSLFGVRDRVQGLTWNVEGCPRYENVTLA